jgi:hypothetical protein
MRNPIPASIKRGGARSDSNMDARADLSALILGKNGTYRSARTVKAALCSLSNGEVDKILKARAASAKHAWVLLTPHVNKLRSSPYYIWTFQDNDVYTAKDSLALRDWCKDVLDAPKQQAPTHSSHPRDAFALWTIFQERQNAQKVYLSRQALADKMTRLGHDHIRGEIVSVSLANDACATHVEYAKMQAAVRAMLKGAAVLRKDIAAGARLPALDDAQVRIARGIVGAPFSLLTGGAGTGKSTVISAIVAFLLNHGVPVVCLAPTHRAKKVLLSRMPDGCSVTTIDAFVRQTPGGGDKFIIVDESSMVDLYKMARLAKAVIDGGAWQLCMAGDAGQLEPIGHGEMFRTALRNGGDRCFTLEKCYRTDNPDLFAAQTQIRDGVLPMSSDSVGVILRDTDADVENEVAKYAREHRSRVQYIAWTNKMCAMINSLVQELERGHACDGVCAGDRVIYGGQNEPSKRLTNAMTGVVRSVSQTKALVEWHDEGEIECAVRDVSLAYCVTVHKAQGSEFPRVCVVATSVSAMQRSLDRRWLYTAVSRARETCDVFSTKALKAFTSAPLKKREMVGISFKP